MIQILDGYNDLVIFFWVYYNNYIYNDNFIKFFIKGGFIGYVDIFCFRVGMNGGVFWSVFWFCLFNGLDFLDFSYSFSQFFLYFIIFIGI